MHHQYMKQMTINIKIISSGSHGNCYKIETPQGNFLIECGIDITSLKKALNFNLSGIKVCVVSHLHSDHCMSMYKLASAGIDIYIPDMKYVDESNAERLSGIKNYPLINHTAVKKMYRPKKAISK